MLAAEAYIVALDSESGQVRWQAPITKLLGRCRSILYLQYAEERLIATGSYPENDDTSYQVVAFDAADAKVLWNTTRRRGKRNEFGHGEQVHHPVVLGDHLVVEPVVLRLSSGEQVSLNRGVDDWRIVRPGHSCGTMSGAGDCVFFRADNPVLMDLRSEVDAGDRFLKLASSRPGCWINIIPAAGLVLIPEASAGCICHYSLQTSMAFLPVQETADRVSSSPDNPSSYAPRDDGGR